MATTSLSIWYYALSIASYTLYPPLSVLIQAGSIPDWILALHYVSGILCLLFLGISAFKRETARWIIGLVLVASILIYYVMTIHFMSYENYI